MSEGTSLMEQTFFGPSKFLSYLGRIPAAEIFEFRFKDVGSDPIKG